MNDRNEADLLSSDGGGEVVGPNMGGAVPFPTYTYPKTQNPSQNHYQRPSGFQEQMSENGMFRDPL